MTVAELAKYLEYCSPDAIVRVSVRYGSLAVRTVAQTDTKGELIFGFGDDE